MPFDTAHRAALVGRFAPAPASDLRRDAVARIDAARRAPAPAVTPAAEAAACLRTANATLSGVLKSRGFVHAHMIAEAAERERDQLAYAADMLACAARALGGASAGRAAA